MYVYVCLSDYFPSHKRLLHCRKGEKFIIFNDTHNTDPHWIYGVSGDGNVGYLPRTYMKLDQISDQEFLEFLDFVLEVLHKKAGTDQFSHSQGRALKKLAEIRAQFQTPTNSPAKEFKTDSTKPSKERSDLKPSQHVNPTQVSNSRPIETIKSTSYCQTEELIQIAEPKPQTTEFSVQCEKPCEVCESRAAVSCQNKSTLTTNGTDKSHSAALNARRESLGKSGSAIQEVPKALVPEMIERVRNRTQLSHVLSVEAVKTIIDCMSDVFPSLSMAWQVMLRQLSGSINANIADVPVVSKDKERLHSIFEKLWSCRNDEQQRSWPVHEDEDAIRRMLEELTVILVDANPLICCEVIKEDHYDNILMLVTYYQMEPRRSLRLAMLQLFQVFCELDFAVINVLLNTILPMEIARDMMSNSEDHARFKHSAKMLTIIFSTGDEPPLQVYEHMNENFIMFLLNFIEDSLYEETEEIGDASVALLLAFNLHFKSNNENIVVQSIKKRADFKVLSEKLLLLFNREIDPTCLIIDEPSHENSVIKMLCDLFDDAETAQFFYTNDICVLIDIIVRQLTDLPVSEALRLNYLHLARNVIRNSSYEEHFHQQGMLQKCFSVVLGHEYTSQVEKQLVTDIVNEFSSWFHP